MTAQAAFREVMLDLETYGTGRDAAIASIGACRFSLEEGVVASDCHFHERVDLTLSSSPGVLTAATVEWWFAQEAEARTRLVRPGRVPLQDAVVRFARWATSWDVPASKTNLWSNGPNFDEVILSDAFARHREPFPYPYWNSRDVRTLYHVGKAKSPALIVKHSGVPHDALDDAIYQAQKVIACYRALVGK